MNIGRKNVPIAARMTTPTANIVAVTLALMMLLLFSTTTAAVPLHNAPSANNNSNNGTTSIGTANGGFNNKVVFLNFYDSFESPFLNAKPILDQYGFKATFFIVCNWMGQDAEHMTWQDIAALQNDGQDIESHSMNHKHLDHVSASDLDFELGQSKKCLADHNINSTIFGSPYGEGWNNSTVINTIAKYYDFGRQGFTNLMFLHCDGYTKDSSQKDCRTYFDNGTLTFAKA